MTTFEVISDPLDIVRAGSLPLGDDHEILPEDDWLRTMRREFRMPDLFMYRHRRNHTFVVCKWTIPPTESVRPCALELMAIPMNTKGQPHWLPTKIGMAQRLRPADEHLREIREREQGKLARERDMMMASAAEAKSYGRHLRKQGLEAEGIALESGQTPYIGKEEGGEDLELLTKTLIESAKRA